MSEVLHARAAEHLNAVFSAQEFKGVLPLKRVEGNEVKDVLLNVRMNAASAVVGRKEGKLVFMPKFGAVSSPLSDLISNSSLTYRLVTALKAGDMMLGSHNSEGIPRWELEPKSRGAQRLFHGTEGTLKKIAERALAGRKASDLLVLTPIYKVPSGKDWSEYHHLKLTKREAELNMPTLLAMAKEAVSASGIADEIENGTAMVSVHLENERERSKVYIAIHSEAEPGFNKPSVLIEPPQ